MKETEKLKLKLPEISDWADIAALNDNFQALDSWLEQLKSDIIAKLNDTPAKDHTHTKKDITDFPESMPASDVYDWAKQPGKPAYTAGEVGAAPSGHTHDDRYYTEAETNNLLAAKQNASTAITTGNIGSQNVNYATYAAIGNYDQDYGARLRNQALVASDTTPPSNGQIYWTYG